MAGGRLFLTRRMRSGRNIKGLNKSKDIAKKNSGKCKKTSLSIKEQQLFKQSKKRRKRNRSLKFPI
jgi:hypothetical protein